MVVVPQVAAVCLSLYHVDEELLQGGLQSVLGTPDDLGGQPAVMRTPPQFCCTNKAVQLCVLLFWASTFHAWLAASKLAQSLRLGPGQRPTANACYESPLGATLCGGMGGGLTSPMPGSLCSWVATGLRATDPASSGTRAPSRSANLPAPGHWNRKFRSLQMRNHDFCVSQCLCLARSKQALYASCVLLDVVVSWR